MTKRTKLLLSGIVLLAALGLTAGKIKDQAAALYHAHAARPTAYPAATQPDQVVLTWSGDPRTTQTVQWRMATGTQAPTVQYKKDAPGAPVAEVDASVAELTDPLITNNPSVLRLTAQLTGLEPGTVYTYRAGSKSADAWSPWYTFRTAPTAAEAFSFFYLGDVQKKYDDWKTLLDKAAATAPAAAFCVFPGDLANQGNDRDDWDGFFHAAEGFFARYPLVSAIGNHECPRDEYPRGYIDQFVLPENGPGTIPKEHAYTLRYGNALFVVLDTNVDLDAQRSWLEAQLKNTDAVWKFVAYHEPLYPSVRTRPHRKIMQAWSDLFDQYHVDMVFQGHDHAYLRTHPMKAGKAAATAAEGTYYCVAVSGGKFYPQAQSEYAEKAFDKTATFQVLNIETAPVPRMTYRAYDGAGAVRDELVIEKKAQ